MEERTEWQIERVVAGRLGLSRNEVRRYRDRYFKLGVDWDTGKARTILLSPHAVYRLEAFIANGRPSQEAPPEKSAPGPPGAMCDPSEEEIERGPCRGQEVELVASGIPCINRSIVIAYLADADPKKPREQIRVRVPAAFHGHFTQGMTFPAVWVGPRFAETRGRPRMKGRWR